MRAGNTLLAGHFSQRNVVLDAGQRRACDVLDGLQARIPSRLAPLRRAPALGAYLWGEPGRGKTMLMDGLFSTAAHPARRIHYHQFLRDLHRGRAQAEKGQADYLGTLARKVAQQCRIFCLDEFHLHDVADAILMERFLAVLLNERVLVILTSNYAPEQLLPDPLLHRHALPLIALIGKHMSIVRLDGERDYRYREPPCRQHYLHPCGEATDQALQNLAHTLGMPLRRGPDSISLHGRSIPVRGLGEDGVWFDFQSICLGPRSHLDYLEISERWSGVIVSDMLQSQLNKADGLRRFIWLVDILYDRRRRLLLGGERPVEQMLRDVPCAVDMERTLSRLAEMQSASFAVATPLEMSPLCP
ncbi:cell division protein ZapE [Azohydromonas lata]|uniref:cell division protein ZapE n=1 Tax=Azohydromonas lata TaxID=45677 RepID=UPI00082C0189|nr:cell division protein ZapE [Azohydromonas lata]